MSDSSNFVVSRQFCRLRKIAASRVRAYDHSSAGAQRIHTTRNPRHEAALNNSASTRQTDMTVVEDRDTPASLVTDESRLQQAPRISAAWCGDELVLLDATTGRYFTLNRVGGRMWELLATSRSAKDLAVCLRAEYDVPPATGEATLERDVLCMLDNMRHAGLLVAASPSSAPTLHTSNPRRNR
jgi:hypothetical protein